MMWWLAGCVGQPPACPAPHRYPASGGDAPADPGQSPGQDRKVLSVSEAVPNHSSFPTWRLLAFVSPLHSKGDRGVRQLLLTLENTYIGEYCEIVIKLDIIK